MPIISYSREIEQIAALETITGAYSEIAALRIDNIKSAFEQNSLYYEEISQIYHLVKRIANSKESHTEQLADTSSNRLDTLYVAITSNHGFYGPLNSDAVDTMIKDARIQKAECMIIGAMGISYARSMGGASPFISMAFSLDEPTPEEIYQFLGLSLRYKRIFVYYPKYRSCMRAITRNLLRIKPFRFFADITFMDISFKSCMSCCNNILWFYHHSQLRNLG